MPETPTPGGPTLLTTSAAAIFTAPVSGWCILRSIHVCNETDMTEAKVTLGINTTATDAAGKRIIFKVPVLGSATKSWPEEGGPPLFIPIANSAVVYALSDQSNALTVTLGLVTGP